MCSEHFSLGKLRRRKRPLATLPDIPTSAPFVVRLKGLPASASAAALSRSAATLVQQMAHKKSPKRTGLGLRSYCLRLVSETPALALVTGISPTIA
jgi:hypothetical protein